MQPGTHLVIIKDSLGNYYVAVQLGADRILMTPPLWSQSEAQQVRQNIFAESQCPPGELV